MRAYYLAISPTRRADRLSVCTCVRTVAYLATSLMYTSCYGCSGARQFYADEPDGGGAGVAGLMCYYMLAHTMAEDKELWLACVDMQAYAVA